MENNNEQQGNEEDKTTSTTEDNANRNDSQNNSPIERANIAAERLEKATEERNKLLDREEKFYATQKLGGRSEGAAQEVKKVEQTAVEYKNEVLAGLHNGN